MWQPIDRAPKDRKVVVICASGQVHKAWWYECDARGKIAMAVRGWVNGSRVLEGGEAPTWFCDLPFRETEKIEPCDDPNF